MIVLQESRRERLVYAIEKMIEICEKEIAPPVLSLEVEASSDDLEEWKILLSEVKDKYETQ